MATIDTLSPISGPQGTLIALSGAGLDTSGLVRFEGLGAPMDVEPVSATATAFQVAVPDFDGQAGTLQVSIVAGDDQTNALAFELEGYPAIENVLPLCPLYLLKQLLGVAPGETNDQQLLAMIRGASAAIVRETRETFQPVSIDGELRDGDGTALLELSRTPILRVRGLRLAGESIDSSEVKVYPGYLRFEVTDEYNPRLRGTSRVFPRGNQNIGVDYDAGFDKIPYDIAMACAEQTVYIQNTLTKAGVVSVTNSVANSSMTYSTMPLAPNVQRAVNRYRRQRVAVI